MSKPIYFPLGDERVNLFISCGQLFALNSVLFIFVAYGE